MTIDTSSRSFSHQGKDYTYEMRLERTLHHSSIYTATVRDATGEVAAVKPGVYYRMGTGSDEMKEMLVDILKNPDLAVTQAAQLEAAKPQVHGLDDLPGKGHLRVIDGGKSQEQEAGGPAEL